MKCFGLRVRRFSNKDDRFASNSTAGTSLTAIFYFLAQNRSAQDALYEEISKMYDPNETGQTIFEQCSSMPYM
jgi:hypothetical protein